MKRIALLLDLVVLGAGFSPGWKNTFFFSSFSTEQQQQLSTPQSRSPVSESRWASSDKDTFTAAAATEEEEDEVVAHRGSPESALAAPKDPFFLKTPTNTEKSEAADWVESSFSSMEGGLDGDELRFTRKSKLDPPSVSSSEVAVGTIDAAPRPMDPTIVRNAARVVEPILKGEVKSAVPEEAIKGALMLGAAAAALAGKGVVLTGAASIGTAYLAITTGPVGEVIRNVGNLAWNIGTGAVKAYKAAEETAAARSAHLAALRAQRESEAKQTAFDAKQKAEMNQRSLLAARIAVDLKERQQRARLKIMEHQRWVEEALRLEQEAALLEQRLAEVARLKKEARIAEEAQRRELEDQERLAAEVRKAEKARQERMAELARIRAEEKEFAKQAQEAEQRRQAEEVRIAEEARVAVAEEARLAEIARKEESRLTEIARKQEEARAAAEARLAEIARKQEGARVAEEARLAEIARKQEEARVAEEARLAEIARKQEEARLAKIARKQEEARLAEIARKQEEARLAEIARKQEEARSAQAVKEEAKRVEKALLATEAEKARKAEEAQEMDEADWNASIQVAQESIGANIVGLKEALVDDTEKLAWAAAKESAKTAAKRSGGKDEDVDRTAATDEALAAQARAAVAEYEAQTGTRMVVPGEDDGEKPYLQDRESRLSESSDISDEVGGTWVDDDGYEYEYEYVWEEADADGDHVGENEKKEEFPAVSPQLPSMVDWSSYKVSELRKELGKRGLATKGKKTDLVAMLEQSDLEQFAQNGVGDDNNDATTSAFDEAKSLEVAESYLDSDDERTDDDLRRIEDGDVDTIRKMNFETLTIPQLKDELRARGLRLSGKKSDLVTRLESFEAKQRELRNLR